MSRLSARCKHDKYLTKKESAAPIFGSWAKGFALINKSTVLAAICAINVALWSGGSSAAQEASSAAVDAPVAPPVVWGATCTSMARTAEPDCSMEMRILMTNGGQLLTGVTIRVPAETHKAVILVHAPVGLYLPAGLQLLVDDAQVEKLELQTCDNSGCYAGGELTDKTIAALRAGQSLAVVFQDLNKKPISVPVPLNGFSAAYQSIK